MSRASLLGLLLFAAGCARPGPPGEARAYGPESITFGGSGFRAVELDGYGTARGPHWPLRSSPPTVAEDIPEHYRLHGAPIAYLAGSTAEAELIARVPGTWAGEVAVSAAGGEWRFAGTGRAHDGELRAHVRATHAFPGSVSVHDLRLRWRATSNGRSVTLGTSRSRAYVLLGEPRGPLLHTALEIAATHAAGATSTEALVEGAWRAFAGLDVRRARDRRPLRYYGEYLDGAPAELRRFLVSGTGQCVAWSHLLYATVAAHGVRAQVVSVLPPAGGRLYIGPWRFIDGARFIDAGANGVAETGAAGDDVAWITAGRGVPHGRIWAPDPLPTGRLGGDDTLAYMVGRNGLADSRIDTALALPLLARGFGLEQQRAYRLDPDARVAPRGDDVIVSTDTVRYLLTGANGVLETERQEGAHATGAWDPVPGHGSTALRVQSALPRPWPITEIGGDDREWGWRLTTGNDGVSQTRGARFGRGVPHATVIGAGPDGRLESTPGGDDRPIDIATFVRSAPAGFTYVSGVNTWPEPGARAQQNPWPPTEYASHMVVLIGARYYDPSFGRGPFESPLAWERALLAAVGVRVHEDDVVRLLEGRPVHAVRRADGVHPLTRFAAGAPPY